MWIVHRNKIVKVNDFYQVTPVASFLPDSSTHEQYIEEVQISEDEAIFLNSFSQSKLSMIYHHENQINDISEFDSKKFKVIFKNHFPVVIEQKSLLVTIKGGFENFISSFKSDASINLF